MNVADLMTREVACCRVGDPLSVAARLMWMHDCGAIPVVDEAGEQVVGMVTDRDICMSSWTQGRAPSEILASEAMSRTLFSCAPEDSLAYAEEVMRLRQVRRVPVIDTRRHLVGILSIADIALEGERDRARLRKDVVPDEVAFTLADICQPTSDDAAQAQA